jgi:CDP-glucose 4,6-dehydratase
LAGYLILAQALYERGNVFAEGWNFGPSDEESRSVRWVVDALIDLCPGSEWQQLHAPQPHEAHLLKLDCSKARTLLGWRPQWALPCALEQTVAWHRDWRAGRDMWATTLAQIDAYLAGG